MNSHLFQPPCILVLVIADEFSVVPTSMFFVFVIADEFSVVPTSIFLVFVIADDSQLFQPPCILVFVTADEFSVVPTSMFSCICYCRWILSCSNLHVFLYLLLQMNSQLFQPPCFLVFVIAGEFSVVPTSMYSCICYCRWILSCSNLFYCICYCRWILSCSNLHVFLYLLLQMNSQLKKTWRSEQLRIHLQ